MSTVKISQLPAISHLNANTANTLFVGVDVPTGTTGKISVKTLAENIFENDVLKVGLPDIIFSNVIAQLAGNGTPYLQVNLQNLRGNGSSDYVATADTGTDSKYYVDLGINGSTYNDTNYSSTKLLDSYLFSQGDTAGTPGGNLVIGTATSSKLVHFVVGGTQISNIVMTLRSTGPAINSGSYLTFADGSAQAVAAAPENYTQSAFNAANTAAANTVVIQGVNVTQNNNLTFVNQYAASAYAQSNTNATNITAVNQYANSAYASANTNATNIISVNQYANTAFNRANNSLANTPGTFGGDLTIAGNLTSLGTVTSQGVLTSGNNVVLGTSRIRNASIDDNTPVLQIVAAGNNFSFMQPTNPNYMIHIQGRDGITSRVVNDAAGNNITSSFVMRTARGSANTPTNVLAGDIFGRISTVGYATTGFSTASDARIDFLALENFSDTNKGTAIAFSTTQNTTNNLIRTAIFGIGNTSIFSTNNYVSGNLIVAATSSLNGVTVNGTMILANSNFSATEAAFRITAAGSSQTPTQSGTLIQLTNKPNVPARVLIDSFGTSNAAYSIIAGRTARGTVDTPTATQNNDILLRIAGNSYGTTGYAPFGDARIDFVATENRSDTNRGSRIRFWNTPNGSNVVNEIASFNASSVTFTGAVEPQKGFIYTPRLPVGNQTAITINYLTDSMIKANLVADLTVSHSNFVTGKVVEMWLVNTDGSGRTVTHGLTALNSTTNSTTFTIRGTSSAYLKFFSIGGDLANTFVSVVYA